MNRSDLPRVAAAVRGTAEGLDQHGALAWDITQRWRAGTAAQRLEATRSRTLGDPTARAALTVEADPHDGYRRALAQLHRLTVELGDLFRAVAPLASTVRWCFHCQGAGVNTPARRTIQGRHACDWCYRRWLRTGSPPTPQQVARHLAGGRVR